MWEQFRAIVYYCINQLLKSYFLFKVSSAYVGYVFQKKHTLSYSDMCCIQSCDLCTLSTNCTMRTLKLMILLCLWEYGTNTHLGACKP